MKRSDQTIKAMYTGLEARFVNSEWNSANGRTIESGRILLYVDRENDPELCVAACTSFDAIDAVKRLLHGE